MKRVSGLLLLVSSTVAAVGTLIALPSAAEACSAPCLSQKPVFADRLLPSNVGGLLLPPSYGSTTTPELTLNGKAVGASVRTVDGLSFLVPEAPLTDGAYAYTYTERCGGTNGPTKAEFAVGAAVPDPENTGTISVATSFVKGVPPSNEPTYVGGCGGSFQVAYDRMVATITFQPARDLKAYLPIMSFSQELAGPGNGFKSSFAVPPDAMTTGLQVATISVACNPSAAPNENPPGIYTMTIAGKVFGSGTTLPSSVASLDLTCPAGAGVGDGDNDKGFNDSGSIAKDIPKSSEASGCSIGVGTLGAGAGVGGGARTTFGALGIGVVSLVLAARRRRRARV